MAIIKVIGQTTIVAMMMAISLGDIQLWGDEFQTIIMVTKMAIIRMPIMI
jgi:hypothetical protein